MNRLACLSTDLRTVVISPFLAPVSSRSQVTNPLSTVVNRSAVGASIIMFACTSRGQGILDPLRAHSVMSSSPDIARLISRDSNASSVSSLGSSPIFAAAS